MISRCSVYDREIIPLVDCYGVVSIYSNYGEAKTKYSIYLNKWDHVADINNFKQFKVVGDKFFVVSQGRIGYYKNSNGGYDFWRQLNGKSEPVKVDSEEQIPRYLVFNIHNGDTEFYVSLQEMPPEVRKIFDYLSKYDRFGK